MRTPQLADNLRRAVLQAAIEGKLNDRTSEDARDLLAAIQTEKAAQQKTGKQKKNKPLAAISEEEIPFAISNSTERNTNDRDLSCRITIKKYNRWIFR